MTWMEIKKAVTATYLTEEVEILAIECQAEGKGDKTFSVVRLGKGYKLIEKWSEQAEQEDAAGCST